MKTRISFITGIITAFLTGVGGYGQQPETFTRSDFQLRGPVKQLLVRASYGQEQFDFDRDGRLTKAETRYSDKDYDITYYIFSGAVLKERRDEVYRDGAIDRQASIARIYQKDSASNQMLEAVSSYDRSITEQITLQYDSLQRLTAVRRAYNEGVDFTRLDYQEQGDEEIQHFSINGMRYKTVRAFSADSIQPGYRVTRTETLRMGVPQTALELVTDAQDRKISEHHYKYNTQSKVWEIADFVRYSYNSDGLLTTQTSYTASGKIASPVLEFTYQMDGATPANWVRKVTRPELSIVAREVFYY